LVNRDAEYSERSAERPCAAHWPDSLSGRLPFPCPSLARTALVSHLARSVGVEPVRAPLRSAFASRFTRSNELTKRTRSRPAAKNGQEWAKIILATDKEERDTAVEDMFNRIFCAQFKSTTRFILRRSPENRLIVPGSSAGFESGAIISDLSRDSLKLEMRNLRKILLD
jgi:hypothetical protein